MRTVLVTAWTLAGRAAELQPASRAVSKGAHVVVMAAVEVLVDQPVHLQ